MSGAGEWWSGEPNSYPTLDWAPTPEPTTPPPISRSRAYLEVAGVFAAFFGASIGEAAASLSGDLPGQSRLAWGIAGPGAFGGAPRPPRRGQGCPRNSRQSLP